MKNIIKIGLLSLVFAAAITSCTNDFLDVNRNPNNPSESTAELTLPAAEEYFVSLNATSMNYLGNQFMYNWATPSDWQANGDALQYNVTTTFFSNIFETSYGDIFKNLKYVKDYEKGGENYNAFDAIAEVIRGFQYQYLVDLYGNVPYSEANLRSENLTPKYDDASTIYKAEIDSLTAAANTALNLPADYKNPGSSDIIFGGDMTKWAQFANTIKLRYLIRLSNTGQDQYIKDQIAKIDANGAGYITADVTANPGYSNDEGKQNSFYGYQGFQTGGTEYDRHSYTVATDYVIDNLKNTNDPRLTRLYAESENNGDYKGVFQSINPAPIANYKSTVLSKVGPGLLKSADQDQPIMLKAEALFLQAEAVQRNYMNGNAQSLYEDAITSSFQSLGVPNAATAAATYYGQSMANVSWAASSDKIEAIITQKWTALNGVSGIEPFVEYTRTGFPKNLPISTSASTPSRPVSLLYPSSEYSRNADNVPSRTPADAFTRNPFWK